MKKAAGKRKYCVFQQLFDGYVVLYAVNLFAGDAGNQAPNNSTALAAMRSP